MLADPWGHQAPCSILCSRKGQESCLMRGLEVVLPGPVAVCHNNTGKFVGAEGYEVLAAGPAQWSALSLIVYQHRHIPCCLPLHICSDSASRPRGGGFTKPWCDTIHKLHPLRWLYPGCQHLSSSGMESAWVCAFVLWGTSVIGAGAG
jgi:hypothetical protein